MKKYINEYWRETLTGAVVTAMLGGGAELWRSGGEYGAKPPAQCQPEADIAMWQGISNSSNPADFMEYLTRCPNGNFVGIAKNRLQELYKPNPLLSLPPSAPKMVQELSTTVTNFPSIAKQPQPKITIETRYFRVVGIDSGDVLKMRTQATPRSDTNYQIPYDADCLKDMGETQIYQPTKVGYEDSEWYKIQFNSVSGWVNSKFLLEDSTNCYNNFSQQPIPVAIPVQPSSLPTQVQVANEPQQPVVEFVRNYYQFIKQVPYENSWAMLSDNFKLTIDFDSYKQWWDTVNTIQLTEVEQINQNTIKVVLQRSMKNGRKVCSVITSQIIEYQNGWFIDKQERKNCKSKQSKNIASSSSQNWMQTFNKYQASIQMPAPNGFVIKNAPSLIASTIKEKTGYDNLNVVGHIDADGKRFYMTEWSWNQHNKGKNPSWILLN